MITCLSLRGGSAQPAAQSVNLAATVPIHLKRCINPLHLDDPNPSGAGAPAGKNRRTFRRAPGCGHSAAGESFLWIGEQSGGRRVMHVPTSPVLCPESRRRLRSEWPRLISRWHTAAGRPVGM